VQRRREAHRDERRRAVDDAHTEKAQEAPLTVSAAMLGVPASVMDSWLSTPAGETVIAGKFEMDGCPMLSFETIPASSNV
jgi:hypothetical protein